MIQRLQQNKMQGYKTQCHFDNNPPNPLKQFKWILLAIAVGLLIVFIHGCYTPNKATKQLNKAHDTYPTVVAEKLSQWYPPKQLPIIHGTIKQKPDSSQFYKNLANQLRKQKVLVRDSLRIKDTCQGNDSDTFDGGYDFGYKIGLSDGKGSCPQSTEQHDTTNIIPSETLVQIDNLQKDTASKHDTIISLNTKLQDSDNDTTKWRRRFWWLFAIVIIYTGFKVFNYFKPTPIKV